MVCLPHLQSLRLTVLITTCLSSMRPEAPSPNAGRKTFGTRRATSPQFATHHTYPGFHDPATKIRRFSPRECLFWPFPDLPMPRDASRRPGFPTPPDPVSRAQGAPKGPGGAPTREKPGHRQGLPPSEHKRKRPPPQRSRGRRVKEGNRGPLRYERPGAPVPSPGRRCPGCGGRMSGRISPRPRRAPRPHPARLRAADARSGSAARRG